MKQYEALRKKYFLPIKPLDYYVEVLKNSGFSNFLLETQTIEAHVEEWADFLCTYHEGILGRIFLFPHEV
jgi:ASC-1-like (ASCH) protein